MPTKTAYKAAKPVTIGFGEEDPEFEDGRQIVKFFKKGADVDVSALDEETVAALVFNGYLEEVE